MALIPSVAPVSDAHIQALIDASIVGVPVVNRLGALAQQMVSPPTVTVGVAEAGPTISGVTVYAYDTGTTYYTYLGSPTALGVGVPDNAQMSPQGAVIAGDAKVFGPWAVEFMYDGAAFEMYVKGTGGHHRVTVIGEGYDTRAGALSLPSDGSVYWVKYDFGDARSRHIRVDGDSYAGFGGLRRETAATISKITDPTGLKVVVLGDSFTEGTGATNFLTGFGDRLQQYLGTRNLAMSGYGGTGYLNDNPSGIYGPLTFRDRVQEDVIDQDPDIVIVAGGINDNGLYVEADFETEADLLFDAIKTGLPDCNLIVVGPWYPRGNTPENIVSIRDSLIQTSQPYARLFIDNIGGTVPYTGSTSDYLDTGWMTGTGYVTNEQYDGNADYYTGSDSTHPTQAGHDYLALKLAEAIAQDAPELLG